MKQSPVRFGSPTYEKSNSGQINENLRKNSNFSDISQNIGVSTPTLSLLSRNLDKILEMEQRVMFLS